MKSLETERLETNLAEVVNILSNEDPQLGRAAEFSGATCSEVETGKYRSTIYSLESLIQGMLSITLGLDGIYTEFDLRVLNKSASILPL